jgi:hypothetical protein
MVLVAVAAVVFRWPDMAYLAIPPAAYLVAEWAGLGVRGRARLGILLGAVYLPSLLGFFTDCGHCRETWLRLFPITPTLAPSLLALKLIGVGRLPDPAEFALASLAVCGLLAVLQRVGGRGRAWLLGAVVFGFGWSCAWAWVLHAIVRS